MKLDWTRVLTCWLDPRATPYPERVALVLLLDTIVAECEATKTRLAGLEQRSQDGWVVTKL